MTKRNHIKSFFTIGVAIIATALFFVFFLLNRVPITFKEPRVEVGSDVKISSLVDIYNGSSVQDGDKLIDTSSIGEHSSEIYIKNNSGSVEKYTAKYFVIDTTPPMISGPSNVDCYLNDHVDLTSFFSATDNSNENINFQIEGNYDTSKTEVYPLKVIASDKSGNSSTFDFTLTVGKISLETFEQIKQERGEYYIKVNRLLNVVMVYTLDGNGEYTKLVKVFVCSTGKPGSETPLGKFKVSDRYETLFLVGNVWGHYTLRIDGAIFFHSVPYFTKGEPWDNLEYEEYNKLGNGASAGCVRLSAIDSKWIFDNIPSGTTVEIYDSESLPDGVTKPEAIKIDTKSENRGWDPTDPDERNPWTN